MGIKIKPNSTLGFYLGILAAIEKVPDLKDVPSDLTAGVRWSNYEGTVLEIENNQGNRLAEIWVRDDFSAAPEGAEMYIVEGNASNPAASWHTQRRLDFNSEKALADATADIAEKIAHTLAG